MKTRDARDVTFNTEIRDGEDIKSALEQHHEFSVTAHKFSLAKLNGPLIGYGFAGYIDIRGEMYHGIVWEFTSIERNPLFLSGDDDDGDPFQ